MSGYFARLAARAQPKPSSRATTIAAPIRPLEQFAETSAAAAVPQTRSMEAADSAGPGDRRASDSLPVGRPTSQPSTHKVALEAPRLAEEPPGRGEAARIAAPSAAIAAPRRDEGADAPRSDDAQRSITRPQLQLSATDPRIASEASARSAVSTPATSAPALSNAGPARVAHAEADAQSQRRQDPPTLTAAPTTAAPKTDSMQPAEAAAAPEPTPRAALLVPRQDLPVVPRPAPPPAAPSEIRIGTIALEIRVPPPAPAPPAQPAARPAVAASPSAPRFSAHRHYLR